MNDTQVVFTLTAKCMDCYRCLKVCPVKAIKMKDGQAQVDASLCIACGTCIRECPQKAKAYLSGIEAAKLALESGNAAALVAPSFAAFYDKWERLRFIGALRRLGFKLVEETAEHAYDVSMNVKRLAGNLKEKHICTACPAFTEYAEKYSRHAVKLLTPVVSPMVQHANELFIKYSGEIKPVFIGPCIAKKKEALKYPGLLDAVLTFEEIEKMFEEKDIKLENCEESFFDGAVKGSARWYPLGGGLLKTAYGEALPSVNYCVPEGYAEIKEAMENVAESNEGIIMEPLFCKGGCVKGPGGRKEINFYTAKKRLAEYIESAPVNTKADFKPVMRAEFSFKGASGADITDAEIEQMLEKTGKGNPALRLNCGACGYNSCREKAAAVIKGMAEPEMCIPVMRRLAEQRTDRIIETSPNGIVIVDREMNIIKMNAAFVAMFRCAGRQGAQISEVIDPLPFEKLASETEEMIQETAAHPKAGITCHQIFYRMKEENYYVGIFVDLTRLTNTDKRLAELKEKTINQAKQLLDHQLKMAQDMALYLGENTAKSEELLHRLVIAAGGKDENRR
ncbi:MAG: Periplasmic (Fe) hydrogenase large subunit [Candidatus Aerophobetes bacterium ADurb.Bin490]|nr:MAG: Periplasmic (Fe) hydrogenase large subunit [Candidatus Aerophobetes bacterium ADurb.Bin490]HPN65243.1 [Fe-Fe] hydrogenase large subunit C-terminal domain-containing protein [Candidatus Goldiibacteriota bacterium]HRQ43463.1 [Fe-Fe] hydrogenase large subunit C-terminal domain-containing protein [Candidatus Goldiibacteriota bacterium]